MPSLSPLSTFSAWRIRGGTRGSVTTACPRAASVGASTTARITASQAVSWPKIAAAPTAPSAIVSGNPRPSSRAGSPTSRRSSRRSTREASLNSTNANVASASARTVSLLLERSTPSSTCGPTSTPNATNTIAGVTGVPCRRREIAATPSSASATMARAHSITRASPQAGRFASRGGPLCGVIQPMRLAGSEPGLDRDPAGGGRGGQGVVVVLVLVGVCLGERSQRTVEAVPAAEVAPDRDRVP